MFPEQPFHLRKILFYQILLGGFFAVGIFYFKGDFLSFAAGFILGLAYAGFTLWLILQLFKGKNKPLVFGAFAIKWGVLALVLYILLKKMAAISFTVGLTSFLSFWFFLALEFQRKEVPSKTYCL